jgi:hypothetical protein
MTFTGKRCDKRGNPCRTGTPNFDQRGEASMQRQNSNTTRANIGARFALGETFITPGAQEALEISGETAIQFLRRHVSADWGAVSEEDAQENEVSLREGFRLLSVYRIAHGRRTIWIITEADRRSTTILVPSEY